LSKVYVLQEQAGKNIVTALDFGEIEVLLPSNTQIGFSAGQVTQVLYSKLSSYTENDYLLLMGDPVIIGIATTVAAHWSNGKVKMLKWDRMEKRYYPIQFNLFHQKGERKNGIEKEKIS
jgi:hypothetical protein